MFSASNAAQLEIQPPFAKNVSELQRAANSISGRVCAYDLVGTILAADAGSGILFFEDNSAATALKMNFKGQDLKPGQRIRVKGTNYVTLTDAILNLGTSPVADADYLHPLLERSGEIYLKAGQHPIRVAWFNRTADYFLGVEYSGPGIARQAIPNSALFHNVAGAKNLKAPGLSYRCFEGQWEKIPDFASLTPQKTGVVSNFDLSVKSRDENVGLEFTGFLEVPEDGTYRFYLSSDDGGQLYLDEPPPDISLLGTAAIPIPQPVMAGQLLSDAQDCFWAETEGVITFMSQDKSYVKFELESGGKKMQVEILTAPSEIIWYLVNSHVQICGICPIIKNAAGQKYAGTMAVASWRDVRVLDVSPNQWFALKSVTIGELTRRFSSGGSGIARLQGNLRFNPSTQTICFEDATASAPIQLLTVWPTENSSNIECLSHWSWDRTNFYLNQGIARESLTDSVAKTNALRVLTTAMQVQRLTRTEAERGYPVKLQGVVTSTSDYHKDFVIQDSTRAVFVMVDNNFLSNFPNVGDYCEVEGVSRPADFSPIVALNSIKILWRGEMPTPVNPTRDQLLSGSLDAQYVEVRGLVIAAHDTYVTLLTVDGVLDLDVTLAPIGQWGTYLNSIIRVRGCLFANWDVNTHRVILDQPIRIHNATVSIDSPPPADLFEADKMSAKDLMQFDVRFDTFRRVKVDGQIIHASPDIYYLMDGATGLRLRLVQPLLLHPGDQVEVVGLVELGGASPVLRQAVARKTGHLPLPEPRPISVNSLSNNYDSTLVSVEGTLVEIQKSGEHQTLKLQAGVKSFVARLDIKHSDNLWPIGSRLKLTGTFRALDGDRLAGFNVNSFELLLNSPADVRIIAQPPWWTSARLLMAMACLLTGLTLAFVWIAMLRHQVNRRTQQLEREISERERAERLRAIEQERSRIARDLHDDLGSTLTEISMMATARPGSKLGSETASNRLQEIAEKSRSMVSALDGVVWVVNSKNDTLSSLIEYLASYAEEFLAKAKTSCRVELPKHYSEQIIESEIRHDIMLAFKETINNAVRHGKPSEVLLRVIIVEGSLEILINDNGCGFEPGQTRGNGLDNLQQRMAKLNGSCQIQCSQGNGATVVLKLPLPQ